MNRKFPLFAALLLIAALGFSQSLTVTKIEPPNWWVGLPAPMLLLYGSGLSDAHAMLVNPPAGVSIAQQKSGKDGLYYFVYLSGTDHAQPKDLQIKLTGSSGSTTITVPLQARFQQPRPQPLTGNDVMYLIMPDRFADGDLANDQPPNSVPGDRTQARAYHGGDLKGITDHLPYLKELGVTVLWLTPVVDNANDSPDSYHGYSAVDLYNTDEHLGFIADYRSMVSAARAQGIRTYADYVPNHIGPKHVWVAHPPEECWLNGTLQDHAPFSDDFRVLTDPHSTTAQRHNTVAGWFFGVLPDMDNDCPDVEQYQVQNAIWWTETAGLDGFRIDTFPYSTRSFWSKWHSDVRKVYPNLSDVGEVINSQTTDPAITAFFQGGRKQFDGIDTQLTTLFDAPLQNVIRGVLLNAAPASQLAAVLSRDSLYPHPEALVTYFGNHDMDRFMGANGASLDRLKLAYGLLATLRGTPQIYYGDEIGMQGGGDPDNRRDFPGGFPNDPQNAFSAGGRSAEQSAIHDYVQAAMKLRHDHPALQSGDLKEVFSNDSIFAFTRTSPNGADALLVLLNSSNQPQPITLNNSTDAALPNAVSLQEVFAMQPEPVNTLNFKNGALSLNAPAQSLTVYQVH